MFRYKVTQAGGVYKVDMSAYVCYEDGGACAEDFAIFSDTEFPIKTCTYTDGLLNPGNKKDKYL